MANILKELQEAGLTLERAHECKRQLQNEISMHDADDVDQQLSSVEQHNNPQTKREERHEERQEKSHEQLAQRIVSLALRAKSDPNDSGLQKMLAQMPIIGRTVGLVRQALEQQPASTAPSPFASMSAGPSPFGRR
jgi:hypothetical protein